MKSGPITCFCVSRTDDVKLLRLMSPIIEWSGSNPRGGRFSASSPWSSLPRAFFHSDGLCAICSRIFWRSFGSGIHMPAGDEAASRLEVQVVAGTVGALPAELEVRPRVGLEGTLVL